MFVLGEGLVILAWPRAAWGSVCRPSLHRLIPVLPTGSKLEGPGPQGWVTTTPLSALNPIPSRAAQPLPEA